jgi:hypothetical protein
VPKVSRQHPVPDVGPARRLVLPVGGVTPPGLTPNRALCHRRPPSHVGTGRGEKGKHTVLPVPFTPRVTSFAQRATGLQPVANPSPGQLPRQVAAQRRFRNGFGPLGSPFVHNLPTNYFPPEPPIRGAEPVGGPSAPTELHRCILAWLPHRLRTPQLLPRQMSRGQGASAPASALRMRVPDTQRADNGDTTIRVARGPLDQRRASLPRRPARLARRSGLRR